jgi:hypothetical protein
MFDDALAICRYIIESRLRRFSVPEGIVRDLMTNRFIRSPLTLAVTSLAIVGTVAREMSPIIGSADASRVVVVIGAATYLACFFIFAIIAAVLFTPLPRPRAALARFIVRAMWLALAIVLARYGTPWPQLGMAVAGAIAGKTIQDCREPANRSLHGFVLVGAILQCGIVAMLIAEARTAAGLIGLGCFLLSWKTTPAIPNVETDPGRVLFRMAQPALAAMLCVLFLTPPRSSGTSSGAGDPGLNQKGPNLHDGIILRSPQIQHVTLIAPVPRTRARNGSPVPARPFHIPFTGEYWFFHATFRRVAGRLLAFHDRPPASSIIETGDPTEWNFTGNGLTMKAYQSLEKPIEITCCEKIGVAIHDSDESPGTYSLELILHDTGPGDPADMQSMSLGDVPGSHQSSEEVHTFDVPRRPSLHSFNAMEVIFHLWASRRTRSANVSIKEFELIPAIQ